MGLSQVQSILGAAFADYDNSGRLSLMLAGTKGARLYQQNEEGRFTDVTRKAGLAGQKGMILSSAKFFDSDNDGLLDLLLTGYVGLLRLLPRDVSIFRETSLPPETTSIETTETEPSPNKHGWQGWRRIPPAAGTPSSAISTTMPTWIC